MSSAWRNFLGKLINLHMRTILTAFLTLIIASSVFGQSSTSTFTTGNIPLNFTAYSAGCNGPTFPLVVTIPAGASVISIDIAYAITAANGAWKSEQSSQIHC
ncbi:MAG: hypothetical protein ACI837_000923 [Crocinitomicaceae bacterium]|jgi:hypothetical protein